MRREVVVDCFPERAKRYRDTHAIVAIDVIRATTTAVTAVATGRRCYPVPTLAEAARVASELEEPLLGGELGGDMPDGFEITNSPAIVAQRTDRHRPLVLLSSSGTQLVAESQGAVVTYLACLRNWTAQARKLKARHDRVAVLGAGTRGEFREEDQLCCAWIAEWLVSHGYEPASEETRRIIARWSGLPASACMGSNSVEYLRRSQQLRDLEFVFGHVDDIGATFVMADGELVMLPASQRSTAQEVSVA
jgi:2-phosphosulfolactate phosphatase